MSKINRCKLRDIHLRMLTLVHFPRDFYLTIYCSAEYGCQMNFLLVEYMLSGRILGHSASGTVLLPRRLSGGVIQRPDCRTLGAISL
jgi:hypothetical protein